jgi:hypothetical protein
VRIICTCSGGDFKTGHINALAKQCAEYAPGVEFLCVTDLPVGKGVTRLPRFDKSWQGWWVEMEMFNPAIKGPLLYMDIDTVVVGSMADILAQTELTVLRDAYRGRRDPTAIQDSCMLLPEEVRGPIWEDWLQNTDRIRGLTGAMQNLFQIHWRGKAKYWQDVLPGQFASWKVDGDRGKDTRVFFFHGRPRPWDVPRFANLY